jgi:hypothetical protein
VSEPDQEIQCCAQFWWTRKQHACGMTHGHAGEHSCYCGIVQPHHPPPPESAPEAEALAREFLDAWQAGREPIERALAAFLLRRDEQQRVAYDQRVKQLQAEWGKDHNELEALRERVKELEAEIERLGGEGKATK